MDRILALLRRVRRGVLARRRLLAGLAAAGAVAAGLQAASAPPRPTVSVWVADHDIAAGSVFEHDDLRQVRFTPASVPDGVIDTARQALGRTAAGPMRSGEPITDSQLVSGSLVAAYPGTVAVPVRILDAGAVALLAVGDRVDILASDPQGGKRAATVVRKVPVVALPTGISGRSAGMVSGGLVVVAVTEAEAARLAQAAVSSVLSVVIR